MENFAYLCSKYKNSDEKVCFGNRNISVSVVAYADIIESLIYDAAHYGAVK